MKKTFYALIICCAASFVWSQNLTDFFYGNASPLTSPILQNLSPEAACDQIIPIPDDLTNGSYLGGSSGNRVAVDVPLEEGSMMTISQIKVSLARATAINYVHFRFLSDNEGLPGDELFEIDNTEIIAEDTLTYINAELGYLRTFTIQLNTPVVLHGNEHQTYWMEVVSDARAWGANPYAEDAIGRGLAMMSDSFEWFELQGIESLYEISAECAEDNGEPSFSCFQGDGGASNGFEDGYSFAQSDTFLIADDFIVEEGTVFNVHQVKMHMLSTQEENISDVTLNFRSDNGGVPGEIIETTPAIVPASQTEIGTAFDIFTVYEVTINLPEPIQFSEGHYWLQPSASATSSDWEVTSIGTTGEQAHTSNDGGETWQSIGYHTVFYIAGECEDDGPVEPWCDQQFTGTDDGVVAATLGFLRAANDFDVAPGVTFSLENITARLHTASETDMPQNYTIYIYNDNGGAVGELIQSYSGITPTVTDAGTYGTTEFPAYMASFDLPAPLALEGGESGTKYWVAMDGVTEETGSTFWISYFYDENINTTRPAYASFDSGATWDVYENPATHVSYDGIFDVNGSCGGGGTSCEQEFTGEIFSGVGFIDDGGQNQFRAANDVNVTAGTQFELQKITLDVVTLAGEPTTFDVYLYNDNNGPAEEIAAYPVIVPASIQENGEFGTTGLPVYSVELELPETYMLTSGVNDVKYWIGVTSDFSELSQPVFWVSSQYTENEASQGTYQSADAGETWSLFLNEDNSNAEGIMLVEGICGELGTSDVHSFDFNYYPNPVKNTLTIDSEKNIKSVSIYNLTGQNVQNQIMNNTKADIQMSSLPSGVYVVKAILENGEVETFKIIKK